jgi:hypothetical protein
MLKVNKECKINPEDQIYSTLPIDAKDLLYKIYYMKVYNVGSKPRETIRCSLTIIALILCKSRYQPMI